MKPINIVVIPIGIVTGDPRVAVVTADNVRAVTKTLADQIHSDPNGQRGIDAEFILKALLGTATAKDYITATKRLTGGSWPHWTSQLGDGVESPDELAGDFLQVFSFNGGLSQNFATSHLSVAQAVNDARRLWTQFNELREELAGNDSTSTYVATVAQTALGQIGARA